MIQIKIKIDLPGRLLKNSKFDTRILHNAPPATSRIALSMKINKNPHPEAPLLLQKPRRMCGKRSARGHPSRPAKWRG